MNTPSTQHPQIIDLEDLTEQHQAALKHEQALVAQTTPKKGLKDITFSDIYISERGRVFMKTSTPNGIVLTEPPESINDDVIALYGEVTSRGQHFPEFFCDIGGVRFRVAKLNDVNDDWYVCRRLMWPLPIFSRIPGVDRPIVRQLGTYGERDVEGLILIGGATGSGKTTTAFSLLQSLIRDFPDVCVTIEDPPELPISGTIDSGDTFGQVFQTPVEGGDFGKAWKRVMRFAPRYIVIGEIRSHVEAVTALHAGLSGHLVLSTIHASSPTAALSSIIDYASAAIDEQLARSLLAQGLLAVIHQRMANSDGSGLRKLEQNYLFIGKDSIGERAKIKAGLFTQLDSAVDVQKNRVARNLMPLDAVLRS